MTNNLLTKKDIETANRLAKEYTEDGNFRCNLSEVEYAVLAMAHLKNLLVKTELDKLLERFNGEESTRAYFATETLHELYKTLLPEEEPLETDDTTIDISNKWAREKDRFKPGNQLGVKFAPNPKKQIDFDKLMSD